MAEEKKRTVERTESLIRISGQDISGSKKVYVGLTKIRGVSWVISNLVCKKLNIEKNMKIDELEKPMIEKIEIFLKNLDAPNFLKNRCGDLETGESKHLIGVNLDMRKEFDIKRLKQIKSYRGLRHSLKLPVRGQRTRSNFRKSGIAVGVKRPKIGKKS
tara:strand:+ start:127 stop:603 length:477 start_codon:yes stop_codon:yes gene_type:complete